MTGRPSTMAELQGFARGCRHRLQLLPVMYPVFEFRCRECGGTERMIWTEQFAGLGIPGIEAIALRAVRASEQQLVPQEVLDAIAARDRAAVPGKDEAP